MSYLDLFKTVSCPGPVKEVSCETKGSYCLCHYCKCEKGQVHCGKSDNQFGYGRAYTKLFLGYVQ